MAKKTPDEAAESAAAGMTHAPALPGLELPDYHGQKPIGMKTALSGAGQRITRAHDLGERVVFVVEGRVKKAGHEETDDGVLYVEALKTVDLFEVGGDAGRRLISSLRQAYRTADDVGKGRRALPITANVGDEGAEVITDGSGVVLTPAELAELRGDLVGVMLTDETTPVVVVFNDGARNLWPDEFEAGEPKPIVGQRFEAAVDGEPEVYVAKVLHAETGETLGEWTEEQENERLMNEELVAVAEERAADAAAGGDVPPPDLPTEEDLAFLAQPVADIRPGVKTIEDLDTLRRMKKAEEHAKDRSTVIAALHERIVELEEAEREAKRSTEPEE